MDVAVLGFVCITSMMLSMLFMPFVIKLAISLNAIDKPGDRKVHVTTVPRLGGIAIAISFGITCLLFIPFDLNLKAFLIGLSIIIVTGVADDLYDISSTLKFSGQIAACLAFLLLSGTSIESFGDLFGAGQIETGIFAIPLTVFCMVGVINALNLSDGLDGLAGGLSVIASLFLAYFAIVSGDGFVLVLVTALVGSLIGFLYYNSHPAQIFMGDTGSLVLGYALSAVCILMLNSDGVTFVAPISLALIFGLPIHDTFMVMTRRVLHLQSPFSPDKTHLHHRLMELKFTHSSAVFVMYAIMFSYGLLALLMRELYEWQQFTIGVAYGLFLFGSVVILQRKGFMVPLDWQMNKTRFHDTELYIRITELMGKSTAFMLWLIPATLLIPLLFFPSIQSSNMTFSFMIGFMIMALFPWRDSHERFGWVHGLIYISTFALLVKLNFIGPAWTSEYLKVLSILVAIWVLLHLFFNRRKVRALMTSSFELLMLTVSLFVPVVLMNVLNFSFETRERLIYACLEAIPFLLAMKFIAHREPKRNTALILCLAGIFFMIGLRQLYSIMH